MYMAIVFHADWSKLMRRLTGGVHNTQLAMHSHVLIHGKSGVKQ